MKTNVRSVLYCLIALIGLSACKSDNEKVISQVNTLISNAQKGDYDCVRKSCRGALRDKELIGRIKFVATIEAIAKEAVYTGEFDSVEEAMDKAMERYYGPNNAITRTWADAFIVGNPYDYPNHETEYKMVDVQWENKNAVTLILKKEDNDWYIVSLCSTASFNPNEEFYTSLCTTDKFTDTEFYDTDTELTWEVISKYYK